MHEKAVESNIYDNISQENILSSVNVELVFETRQYSGANRQILIYYWSKRWQNKSYSSSQGRGRFGRGEGNQNVPGSGVSINNEVRKRSPVNSYDKVTHSICESIYQWAKECPHNESGPYNNS